jgi:allophanate hydrolase
MQGPVLDVLSAAVRVALVGGTGGLSVEGAGERVAVASGRTVRVKRGERLRVGALGPFNCAYLAVEGGFDVPQLLGSAATYTRNRLGGMEGRALEAGDLLKIGHDGAEERVELTLPRPLEQGLDQPIRIVLGPQDDYFTEEAIATFLSSPYTVSPQADRMGFRLEGEKLEHNTKGYNIVSDGIVPGSIQVPGSGQPIVLLVDAQTTGGYPKIATVISTDLPLIGRRRAGSAVRFSRVTQEEAEAIRRAEDARIAAVIRDLQPVMETARLDEAALYASNLVDGVVSAWE